NLFTDEEDEVIKEVFDILGLTHIDLDRNITLSGNTLSGGEIQRLGIARLLMKEATIWILDEPTTALDIYHTNLVMGEINKLSQTLILARYELRLISKFDKVGLLVDDEINEYGDYEALLARNGYLYQMVAINHL